jgi:peroxiredoxin family protein
VKASKGTEGGVLCTMTGLEKLRKGKLTAQNDDPIIEGSSALCQMEIW